MERILEDSKACTGCATCLVSCPVAAIQMINDAKGFAYPAISQDKCISCRRCQQVCPVLHPNFNHDKEPRFLAFAGDHSLLAQSSSGGIFTILAEEMLARQGKVAGAAWQEDLAVSHQLVGQTDDLDKLRYSKYIQSDLQDIFEAIAQALKAGQPVLFTGTPCQVAGIRSFLGDPTLLLTVDLICHGVPSHQMLVDHLQSRYALEDIEAIYFRGRESWSSLFDVQLRSGGFEHKRNEDDLFMQAFLHNISLRPSCGTCPFSRLPRQGDLTIGDLWAAPSLSLEIPWQKGVNLILANSGKGRDFLEKALHNTTRTVYWQQLSGREGINSNVYAPNSINRYAGGYFDQHYPEEPFDQAVIGTLHHYDFGLVQYVSQNYGSIATSLGLCQMLKDFGKTVLTLDHLRSIRPEPKKVVRQFSDLSSDFLPQGDYESINAVCDNFGVGSDMSWCWGDYYEFVHAHTMFLGFAGPEKKCISFAPSMGIEKYNIDPDYGFLLHSYLQNINWLSVREDSTVRICDKLFGRKAFRLLDPVFLCDPQAFRDMAAKAAVQEDHDYIFAYILDPDPQKHAALLKLKEETGKNLIVVLDYERNFQQNKQKMDLDPYVAGQVDFSQWLYWLLYADQVVTDSFHGACLSLIFHKPFAAIHNRAATRFKTLAKMVNTDLPFYSTAQALLESSQAFADLDWEDIDLHLQAEIDQSKAWVRQALTEEGHKSRRHPALLQKIHRLMLEGWQGRREEEKQHGYAKEALRQFNQLIEQGQTVFQAVCQQEGLALGPRSQAIGKLLQSLDHVAAYFEQVRQNHCCVLMVGQDECSVCMKDFLRQANLDLAQARLPGFRHAWLMMTDGREILAQATAADQPLRYHTWLRLPQGSWRADAQESLNNLPVRLVSMGFTPRLQGASYSSIMVRNCEFSCKQRGINGVVVDPYGQVVDAWSVDSFADASLTIKRSFHRN